MNLLDRRVRPTRLIGYCRPDSEWDDALSEQFERLYDEMIDGELRMRRHARLRREFDDEL
ncbi:hypothetical protein [Nocardia sp. NPDC051832]|uniref:hypothetical protein n=1 Tax=Nocardia sp. NPDC051832 TaxID=3155673 RepID=UPI003419A45A